MLAGATSIDELADAVWIVEDDIIVPLTGCSLLWDTLTSGMTCPAAVSGVYRNRHNPKLLVGGTTSDLNGNGTFREFESVPNERLVNVDIVGCGCLMTWLNRPMIPLNWPSHVAGKTPAHDWAYSLEVRRNGGEIFLNTMVRCGHAVNADDVIFP
jgi:hypothetical protein